MKNYLYLCISTCMLAQCSSPENKTENTTRTEEKHEHTVIDTTPKVTGIGGIFFKSANPDSTHDWYSKNLGMNMDEYGAVFEFRNANRKDEINYLRWSAFNDKDNYYDPSKKQFMINYRVQNIEGLVRKLKANGATVVDSITTYDYGKFVHILDGDGNKVELWEPVDSALTKLGGVTNK